MVFIGNYLNDFAIATSDEDLFTLHPDFSSSSVRMNPVEYNSLIPVSSSSIIIQLLNTLTFTAISLTSTEINELQVGTNTVKNSNENEKYLSQIGYFQNEPIEISKGFNGIVDFCPPISAGNISDLSYSFIKLEVDEADEFHFSFDNDTKNLKIESLNKSILSKNSSYSLTADSESSEVSYNTVLKISESEVRDQSSIVIVQSLIIITTLILYIFSIFLGKGLIIGIYLFLNHLRILLLFLLINIYIHPSVRYMITMQNFILFDFTFLTKHIPKILTEPLFIQNLFSSPQKTEECKEIGIINESTFRQYWNCFLIICGIGVWHIGVVVGRRVWERRFRRGDSSRDKGLGDVEESKGMSKEENKEGNKEESEEDENIGEDEGYCTRLCGRLWKYVKECFDTLFSSNFYFSLHFRLYLESFLGVLITTINELKTNSLSTSSSHISYILSIIILISYLLIYIFICYLCYKDYNQSKVKFCNLPEFSKLFYSEIMRGQLRDEKWAVIHVPLELTRTIIFVVGVMTDGQDEDICVIVILGFLLIQLMYWLQAICIRKFEHWAVNIIYIVNESFLIVFIGAFGIWRTYRDYNNSIAREFLLMMILLNSCIFFSCQAIGVIQESYKFIKSTCIPNRNLKTPPQGPIDPPPSSSASEERSSSIELPNPNRHPISVGQPNPPDSSSRPRTETPNRAETGNRSISDEGSGEDRKYFCFF